MSECTDRNLAVVAYLVCRIGVGKDLAARADIVSDIAAICACRILCGNKRHCMRMLGGDIGINSEISIGKAIGINNGQLMDSDRKSRKILGL